MATPNKTFQILKESKWDWLVNHTQFGQFHYLKPSLSLPKMDMQKFPPSVALPPYLAKRGITDVESFRQKTPLEIQGVRDACKYAAEVLSTAASHVRPGITTLELDSLILQKCLDLQCYPSPLGYAGFPKSVCTSVNNVVVHGVPSERPLMEGDIINIDITTFYKGFHGDTSATFLVGSNHPDSRIQLLETTKFALQEAIARAGPHSPVSVIGNTIEPIARQRALCVVHGFVGHGIGKQFHELPLIPHTENDEDDVLVPGTTFTIEPVLSEGSSKNTYECPDGWTVLTADGAPTAQYEHTVLMTDNGCEILTSL
jgi:methionyl aminopeptidase